jgi:anti-anti-sigma factor
VDHPAPSCERTLITTQARHEAGRSRHITRDGPLEIQIDQHQEEWSVELRGELDLANAATLESELRKLNSDGRVLLDLGRLEFIDCAGIALFVRDRARRRSESLRIRPGSGQAERLFQICGFEKRGRR